MRNENMAKIALNAVKLPQFEAFNGKSLSPKTMSYFCEDSQNFGS